MRLQLRRPGQRTGLRRSVSSDQACLPNFLPGGGGAQARGLEIRPGLLRAITANRMDIEPVALGERLGGGGFDLGGEAGQNGQRGGNEGCDSDS